MPTVTKTEIRDALRRVREDLQQLSHALAENKPRTIALYLIDAENFLEEIRFLVEEKYGDAFEAAEEEVYREHPELLPVEEEEEDEGAEEGDAEEYDEVAPAITRIRR